MKKEWIPLMINTRKLKLGFSDYLTHYLIVLFLLIPFLFSLFSFVQKEFLNNYEGVRNPDEMLNTTYPFGIVAIVFYFIQRNKLKFMVTKTLLSKDKVRDIIEETATELEWHLQIINDTLIVAKTHPKWWTGSWGEQITIIMDGSTIMINSICDPDKKVSVVSMGRNKKNEIKLIENIKIASR